MLLRSSRIAEQINIPAPAPMIVPATTGIGPPRLGNVRPLYALYSLCDAGIAETAGRHGRDHLPRVDAPSFHGQSRPTTVHSHRPEEEPMSDPVTKFDARFSEPGSAATPWRQTRAALESAQMFWITTVRGDGRPHVTPLVAVWLDGAVYFSTGDTEQKARNLAVNPHVILATGCGTWNEGLDVVVEGDAVPVTDNALLTRLARAWAAKWDGRWQYQVKDGRFRHPHGGDARVYSVRPAKVLAFGKGSFSHTSHRF